MPDSANSNVENYKTLIEGVTENQPAKVPIVLLNQSFTPAQLCAHFQVRVDKNATTVAARSAYRAAVKDERAAVADAEPLRQALKGVLIGQLGKDSEDLTKYGFTPAKPRKVSSAVKANASAQAAATRKARNPLSKEEKKKIKGVVASPAVPPAAPSPSAPSAPAAATPATPVTSTPLPAVQNGTPPTTGH